MTQRIYNESAAVCWERPTVCTVVFWNREGIYEWRNLSQLKELAQRKHCISWPLFFCVKSIKNHRSGSGRFWVTTFELRPPSENWNTRTLPNMPEGDCWRWIQWKPYGIARACNCVLIGRDKTSFPNTNFVKEILWQKEFIMKVLCMWGLLYVQWFS